MTTFQLDRLRSHMHGPVCLTHEFDRRFQEVGLDPLLLANSSDFLFTTIAPRRTVDITCIVESTYQDKFPYYYASTYTRPPMRLFKLSDAKIVGCAPRIVVSEAASAVVDSYALEELIRYTGFGKFRDDLYYILNRRFELQSVGVPYSEAHSVFELLRRQPNEIRSIHISQPVYSILHRWMEYGHFSHEVCGQIPYWLDNLKPHGIKLLTIRNGWQTKLLKSLGVEDNDVIEISKDFERWDYSAIPIIACDTLYFSHSYEYAAGNIVPELLGLAMRSSLAKYEKKGRWIYASRLDTPNRMLVNEPELIEKLKAMGFEIIIGSKMSVEEQIKAFSEAEIVVGKDGTNLTNIMYCKNGCAFVEILSEAFFDPLYMRIGNLRGVKYFNVLAQIDKSNVKTGRDKDSFVEIDLVVATIDRALKYVSDNRD